MTATPVRAHAPAHARHLGVLRHRPVPQKRAFSCIAYLLATPDAIWYSLTDAEATSRYWRHANVSTWTPGARWDHIRTDGSGIADAGGVVLVADRPRELAFTFGPAREPAYDGPSRVHLTMLSAHDITRIDLRHDGLRDDREVARAEVAWSAVLANLKTYLEVGRPLPSELWGVAAAYLPG